MWNLTPDYIQRIKEELKGRRAAIEARYADEVKTLDADLEEIETLERIAYAFAVKHIDEVASEPAPEAEPQAEAVAPLQALPADPGGPDVVAEPKGGTSRWRMHLGTHSDAEAE